MIKKLSVALAALLAAAACSAQVLNDFSAFYKAETTYFKGSWTAGADSGPIASFQQGAGVFDFVGGTNSSEAGVDFFFMNPSLTDIAPLNVGVNRTLQVNAQTLAGNAATSFVVILFDNSASQKFASATFDLTSISGSSISTVSSLLTAQAGFDWSQVQGFTITGGITGGSQLLNLRMDGLAVIPEPSTYAMILGGLTLGVVVIRRRAKK